MRSGGPQGQWRSLRATCHSVFPAPDSSLGRMDDSEHRLLIKTLAFYVHRGFELEVVEPPVRGRKGPAHDAVRPIGIKVMNPRAFDAIRWELMKRTLGRR